MLVRTTVFGATLLLLPYRSLFYIYLRQPILQLDVIWIPKGHILIAGVI